MPQYLHYIQNKKPILLYFLPITFVGIGFFCGNRLSQVSCAIKPQQNRIEYNSVRTESYNLRHGEYDILPSGSPTIEAYEKMLQNPIYKEWTEVISNQFVKDNQDLLVGYRSLWVGDPLHSWSRGWEYTFVAAAIRKCMVRDRDRDLVLLDVGSGVTFIDWMIAYEIMRDNPRSRVMALDNNAAYHNWFNEINKRNAARARNGSYPKQYAIPKVAFLEYDVEKGLPLPNHSVDIVFCISVMEHMSDGVKAVRNMFDKIVPGGYLVITFDIDINNAIVDHNPVKADVLLEELRRVSKEIYFNNTALRVYNNANFYGDIEKKNDLYTLHEGKKRGLDNAKWIDSKSEEKRRGLFFSCHIFQKPI